METYGYTHKDIMEDIELTNDEIVLLLKMIEKSTFNGSELFILLNTVNKLNLMIKK